MDNHNLNKLAMRAMEGQLVSEEETCQAALRKAVFNGINESDVQDVIKTIVNQAKAGDDTAQKIFFEYILGVSNKPATIRVTNNFHAEPKQAEGT